MNHPHRTPFPGPSTLHSRRPLTFTVALAIALAALLAPGAAFAQRADLPVELRSARDAKPRQAEIEKWIATKMDAVVKGKTPKEQQDARDLLGRQTSVPGGPASPSFLLVYATALNKQLGALAKNPDPRVRLNGAIVLHRVASKAGNTALTGAATTFAADPCAGVSLWATKAAQSILPPLAANGKRPKLGAAIVDGVKKHPDQRELAEEAYRALTLDFRAKPQNLEAPAVPAVLPDVLRLLEARANMYVKGSPPAPGLDQLGAIFVTSSRVWGHPLVDAKQKARIIQQLVNLMGLAAQHAAAREGDNTAREPYTALIRQIGSALAVVATAEKDAKLQAAAKDLTEVGPGIENDDLSARMETSVAALKARYPDLKDAPMIAADAVDEAEPVEEEKPEPKPADDDAGEEPADDADAEQ